MQKRAAHCFSRLIRTEDDREGEGREKRMTDDGKDGENDFLVEDRNRMNA